MKRALITGITGQDGSYLAELLLEKGYEVHGVLRRSSSFNTGRIDGIFDKLNLHYGDVTSPGRIGRIIAEIEPHEIYNLAAQSHVRVSFDDPETTTRSVYNGTEAILDAAKALRNKPRIYQASSSEMYGNAPAPQNEATPFQPCSPYAVAKVAAHHLAAMHRDNGLHVSCGILFNHESPRRGETFVTRKITRAAARIKLGLQENLALGNLDAKRDWGYAPDYVQAMWLMLQQDEPGDYVIATGASYSVREFCEVVFGGLGMDYRDYVVFDERYLRPNEVNELLGDASKAYARLAWAPTVYFNELARMMVESDLEIARRSIAMLKHYTGMTLREMAKWREG